MTDILLYFLLALIIAGLVVCAVILFNTPMKTPAPIGISL